MLLEAHEIQEALDRQFGPLEPLLTGFRLVTPGMRTAEVQELAKTLGEALPDSFIAAITKYDFGTLTIGPIAFCNTGSYGAELARYNTDSVSPWWGRGPRPPGRLLIANSDPYAVLLDCETGAVLAYEHTDGADAAKRVATDFGLFFRGVGSAFVLRQGAAPLADLGRRIAIEVGDSEREHAFWKELAA